MAGRSGLKKMLEEGIKEEQRQLQESAAPKKESSVKSKQDKTQPEDPPAIINIPDPTVEQSDSEPVEKNKGGRPSYESTGETKRKQYTLTLIPEFYNEITAYRDTHKKRNGKKMSFAEFLETAAIEYMDNHK